MSKGKQVLYVRDGEVVAKVVGGRVHLFTRDDMQLHTFNEVASFIWGVLEEPCAESEIVSRVVGEYDVAESMAKADVREFLGQGEGVWIVSIDSK